MRSEFVRGSQSVKTVARDASLVPFERQAEHQAIARVQVVVHHQDAKWLASRGRRRAILTEGDGSRRVR